MHGFLLPHIPSLARIAICPSRNAAFFDESACHGVVFGTINLGAYCGLVSRLHLDLD
jgi:hypothetical protein